MTLTNREQTRQVKQEQAVIEFLLGGFSKKSLADAGFKSESEMEVIKENLLDRLGIPVNFRRQQGMDGLSKI